MLGECSLETSKDWTKFRVLGKRSVVSCMIANSLDKPFTLVSRGARRGRGEESQLLVYYRPETDIREKALGQAGSEKGATDNDEEGKPVWTMGGVGRREGSKKRPRWRGGAGPWGYKRKKVGKQCRPAGGHPRRAYSSARSSSERR